MMFMEKQSKRLALSQMFDLEAKHWNILCTLESVTAYTITNACGPKWKLAWNNQTLKGNSILNCSVSGTRESL